MAPDSDVNIIPSADLPEPGTKYYVPNEFIGSLKDPTDRESLDIQPGDVLEVLSGTGEANLQRGFICVKLTRTVDGQVSGFSDESNFRFMRAADLQKLSLERRVGADFTTPGETSGRVRSFRKGFPWLKLRVADTKEKVAELMREACFRAPD